MLVKDQIDDGGDAIGRYRDAILPAFNEQDIVRLYSELFRGRLADDVNPGIELKLLIEQVLRLCANQGAHLVRLLTRIVRVRAARPDLVHALAPELGLKPVIEFADLLAAGCPDSIREDVAQLFEAARTQCKRYHVTGPEAWIDVLVSLEERPPGGRARPLLLDYLEHVQSAWSAISPGAARPMARRIDALREAHGIAAADEQEWRVVEAPDRCALPIALLAGKHGPVLATEAGEWFAIEANGELTALDPTRPFAAAIVDTTGVVTVACWDGSIKQLRSKTAWEPPLLVASPIALAATDRGVVAGNASGRLTLVPRGRSPVKELVTTAPIVELAASDTALVVLDASGLLTTTSWPIRSEAGLVPIDTAAVGRPFALSPGITSSTLIAICESGIAIVDGSELSAVVAQPAVRTVVAFRGVDRACVVTDTGEALIVDGSLVRVAAIQLAGVAIEGAAPWFDGHVLAWTTDGDLLAVAVDGSVRRLAEGDVVLAAQNPEQATDYIAVHWTTGDRARVSRGRAVWS